MNSYTFHISLYDLLFLGTIFTGLMLALQLWFVKRTHKTANRFLALALLTVILCIARLLAADVKLGAYFPRWNFLPLQFLLALGPLTYFYVLKLTRPKRKFGWKDLLHFSPLLLQLGFWILELAASIKTGTAVYSTGTFHLLNFILTSLTFVSVVSYIYLSHFLIQDYYKLLQPVGMDRPRNQFTWLHRLLKGFGFVLLLWIPYVGINYLFYHNQLNTPIYYCLCLLSAIAFMWLAVEAFFRPEFEVLVQAPPLLKPMPSAELKSKGLWLKKTVEANLFYLDAELTVSSLADKLDMPAYEVSRIINISFKKNFSDFINEYRVLEVARKMQDPAYNHITFLGIAYDSGFNSKSTFNRIFKEMTGQSPAEYKASPKKEFPIYKLGRRAQFTQLILNQEPTTMWSGQKLNRNYMIKNYLLIAIRNLQKNKAFSFINIFGLAVGMAAGLLIIQYVSFELSFDDFQAKKDRVYQVTQDRYDHGKLATQWAGGAFAEGQNFKNNFPQVEDFVKIVGTGSVLAINNDKKIVLEKSYFATPSFFNVFSYPLIHGDPKTALKEVFSAVITESVAQKLFGTTDAVGKTFKYDVNVMKVTGVMKDYPDNTHFRSDLLMSYSTFLKFVGPKNDIDNAWLNDGCLTYLLLRPGVNAKDLEAKFKPYVDGVYKKLNWSGATAVYHLLPLQKIHLSPNLMIEPEPHGDGKSVYLLAGIAIFVIIIAWINYINLATARGIGRAKEVGVRKTLGSAKTQLIMQFMLEAMLLNALAVLLAIILIIVFLPIFSSLSGQNVTLGLLFTPTFWLAVAGLFLVGSFFSGFYPALVLSKFRPVEVMKGKLSASSGGIVLRKVMVIFQFAASIFLLIGSLAVYRQVNFMEKQSLGININQTLVIKQPLAHIDSFYRSMSAFKNECLRDPSIQSLTVSTSIPGDPIGWNAGGIKLKGTDQSQGKQYRIIGGDYDYLKAYGAKLIAGRLFSKDFSTDPHAVVFSEKATEQMGFERPEQAIGKQVDFWGDVYTIIGVVENYHQQSLHDAYDAIIFRCIPDIRGDVSVKISTANLPATLATLKANWKSFFPQDQFDYFFLDQHFNEQYHADKQFGQVFAAFTGIGILVACLGLFGLVSYTIVQRTKEIGIRKVLGASVGTILQLLYKDFALLVLIAFLVSAPLGWYAVHQWLQTYAFRVDISWMFFAVPFITVAFVAMATVSYLSVKAALMNPVVSLKVE